MFAEIWNERKKDLWESEAFKDLVRDDARQELNPSQETTEESPADKSAAALRDAFPTYLWGRPTVCDSFERLSIGTIDVRHRGKRLSSTFAFPASVDR